MQRWLRTTGAKLIWVDMLGRHPLVASDRLEYRRCPGADPRDVLERARLAAVRVSQDIRLLGHIADVCEVVCMSSEMGEHARVPIEPPEQTALVDATMAIPGVLIAGVPGGACVFISISFSHPMSVNSLSGIQLGGSTQCSWWRWMRA